MEVIAHRGFADEGVENSLSALVSAAARADAVEFDVRLSAGGEPVVFHDETVDRLTDAPGPVESYTVDELTSMCLAGTAETIPTLEAVLEEIHGPIVPELKTTAVSDRVRSLLLSYPDPVLVSSFLPEALVAAPDALDTAVLCAPRRRSVRLPRGTPVGLSKGLAVADELGARSIHPHHSQCTAEAVELAQSAGLTVNAWTVRSCEVGEAMRQVGVDGVIADSPAYVAGD